jgi:hypothetical protein
MKGPKITDHNWRPALWENRREDISIARRPCGYMNCRQSRAEHAQAVGS